MNVHEHPFLLQRAFVQLSMERTFNYLRPLRSDLWNAIYGVLGGTGFTQDDMESMIWYIVHPPMQLILTYSCCSFSGVSI
jgi:hypothetical protein